MPLTAPPARRIPYDANGAQVYYRFPLDADPSLRDMEALHPGSVVELNDEDNSDITGVPWNNLRNQIVILLPEKWDLEAYFVALDDISGTSGHTVEVSTNTTTGLDGTWTPHGSPTIVTGTHDNYRDPTLWSQAGIKGFRVEVSEMNIEDFQSVHLYGTITAGESPHRVEWVDDALATVYTVALDGGDVAQASSVDRDVRVRNISGTQTATDVVISAEALYSPGGDNPVNWYTYSLNGAAGPFASTQTIASLGPGAEQTVRIRRVIPASVNPNRHAPRHKAVPTSWA